MKLAILLRRDPEDGGYVASCPALPGCHGQGETAKDARQDIAASVAAMLEHLRAQGAPLPPEETVETLDVAG